MIAYEEKRQSLIAQLQSSGNAPIGLAKDTSNLFRTRDGVEKQRLDVRAFDQVLQVDPATRTIDVEGMTPYAALVDATLPHGVMPAVVPQLKSITIGGAVSGIGIESSSFRYGLPHETVQEMEILLPGGRVVTCRADNEHRDLFHGFPNSYGTLGYALRLKILAVPVRPFVRLNHTRYRDAGEYFTEVERQCRAGEIDFIDGSVFASDEHYITTGTFVDEAPATSDYTYLEMYYRSIRSLREDYLGIRDYIWRWDTDWFWCSTHFGLQHRWMRRLFGRRRLNSVTYGRIMRFNRRWGFTAALDRVRGVHTESVIQDVDIPIDRAAEFLEFFHREIGILPVWICPIGARDPDARFPLYPMDSSKIYVNFGFWDVITTREKHPDGHFNRRIERKVVELGGIKSLYSDSYFPEEEFWGQYDREAYRRLKAEYDPEGRLLDLYAKCVRRA